MPIFKIKLLSLNELLFILIIKRKMKLKGNIVIQFLPKMSIFRFSVIVYYYFRKTKQKLTSSVPIYPLLSMTRAAFKLFRYSTHKV